MSAPRRTIVKVCGLTRREDAAWALACGADWLGFVVSGESPRAIAPERAGEIVATLAGGVSVAVMVGPTPEQALQAARLSRAARLQLHRVDPAGWPEDFPLPCAFAIGVTVTGELASREPSARHLLMLDTADARLAGGTGRTFPWHAARPLALRRDVMLAGGLDADNVADALAQVRAFGVDASSRLESAPGVKDPERVRRWIAAVRSSDERLGAA